MYIHIYIYIYIYICFRRHILILMRLPAPTRCRPLLEAFVLLEPDRPCILYTASIFLYYCIYYSLYIYIYIYMYTVYTVYYILYIYLLYNTVYTVYYTTASIFLVTCMTYMYDPLSANIEALSPTHPLPFSVCTAGARNMMALRSLT